MSELVFDYPCVVFALRRESRAFSQLFPPQQRFPGAPCRARFCGPNWLTVLVLEAGVGPAAMSAAMDWLLGRPMLENVPYRPQMVLSAGFAGALTDQLATADVVVATEIFEEHGRCWSALWPGKLPTGSWNPPLHSGRLLTCQEMITSVERKKELGQRHDSIAVDMEAALVARHCSEQDIPWGCVRAISDDVQTALSSELLWLAPQGKVVWPRLLASVLQSPRLIGEMCGLARNTHRAGLQLATALGKLLTLTLPGTKRSETPG
jgi:nucleoside phosphorylase